jgi:hypothetical protein
MTRRLGNVLYWSSCIVAALVVIYGFDDVNAWIAGVCMFGFGLATRYVLVGNE